jgi:nucleoside-diphosphate-sugar epimerase
MLEGKKILVSGAGGQIALPLCEYLAPQNEVWGIARFSDQATRERLDRAGVTTRVVDLGRPDFSEIPEDFDYLLHLAAFLGPGTDYETALGINADGTGALLAHCRHAAAALVMGTGSVYDPNPDPWHLYTETDPLGDGHLPSVPTYSISKIAEEAVARTCARILNLPIVIARMNVAYGANGGLAIFHLDSVVTDRPIAVRWDPAPYSPIFQDDINEQVEAILAAASVPATIVNWGGDEVVAVQEWSNYFGELTGRTPRFELEPAAGTHRGVALDPSRRLALTGPCRTSWRQGMKAAYELRYPDGAFEGAVPPSSAARAVEALAAERTDQ